MKPSRAPARPSNISLAAKLCLDLATFLGGTVLGGTVLGGTLLSGTVTGAERLVDRTAASGIQFQLSTGAAAGLKHLYESMIGGAGWFDYDGDGRLDLYLVQGHDDSARAFAAGRQSNVLYRNLGDGKFKDVTASAGVGSRLYGSGLAVGDIDNDGDMDLYVTNYGPNVLYVNNGDGTFTDETATSGTISPLWSTSAAFADINGDGLLDLYVANYLYYDPRVHKACTGNLKKLPGYCHPNKFNGAPDNLYLNLGGGRFQDVSGRRPRERENFQRPHLLCSG